MFDFLLPIDCHHILCQLKTLEVIPQKIPSSFGQNVQLTHKQCRKSFLQSEYPSSPLPPYSSDFKSPVEKERGRGGRGGRGGGKEEEEEEEEEEDEDEMRRGQCTSVWNYNKQVPITLRDIRAIQVTLDHFVISS